MSRSGGAGGLADVVAQQGGERIRFLLLSTHYRSTVVYGEQGLKEAATALEGFYRFFERYYKITKQRFFNIPPIEKRADGEIDAKKLFTDGNGTATACGACHTLADAGTSSQTGPDLDKALAGKDAAFVKQSITEPDAAIASGFQAGIMPKNYGDTLSAEELDALVKYLGEVAGK